MENSLGPILLTVSRSDSDVPFPHIAQAGIPFVQGQVRSVDDLAVTDSAGNRLPGSIQSTSHWPDGSVQWCLARFICAGVATSNTEFFLVQFGEVEVADDESDFSIIDSDETIVVTDHGIEFRFSKDLEHVFPSVSTDGQSTLVPEDINVVLRGTENQALRFEKTVTSLQHCDSVSASVEVRGLIHTPMKQKINLVFRFEFVTGQLLSVLIEVHNPHRAQHKDGIWDLGDAGSFLFNEISLQYKRGTNDQLQLKPVARDDVILNLSDCDNAVLFQASSGGANWDSPTHVNAAGSNSNKFCGYAINVDGVPPVRGDRASPVLIVDGEDSSRCRIAVKEFWQNFPKSISVSNALISIGIFPNEHKDGYELQGGERKRHTIYFSFNDNKDALAWVDKSAIIQADPAAVERAGVLANPLGSAYPPYDNLIALSLDVSQGIMAKREVQDEYGWRHFGDVVADHETLYQETDDIFVSHYNNQYDAVYGFARQFISTGDRRWYCLMDELARHVLDIDIYRTTEDRSEYNHGLFWHTDHYLQAYTCSHRTYSKHHYAHDWKGDKGGGPGSEHCYTTGLKLYYYLTGEESAKDTVLGLASWIRYYYEGSGTLIERCKSIISKDFRNFIAICRGHKIFRYHYGFDRGTGNYIRALLDSYELTLDKVYLTEAESIMMNTFGSTDDISARDLDNIEFTWFYTVFLQEVIRYLDLKRNYDSCDQYFCYSRDALLHYAIWMVSHEQPTLTRKDALDHPNDTWVAQDIRKANVLYAAYQYSIHNRQPFLNRAIEFRDYVVSTLAASETLHYSRIQILLLQNHGPSSFMERPSEAHPGLHELGENPLSKIACFYTIGSFLRYLGSSFWRTFRCFSIRREINWVKVRFE